MQDQLDGRRRGRARDAVTAGPARSSVTAGRWPDRGAPRGLAASAVIASVLGLAAATLASALF